MATNFLRIEAEALIVARDSKKYDERMMSLALKVKEDDKIWAEHGVSETELAQMVGGKENLILGTFIGEPLSMMCATYGSEGDAFLFDYGGFTRLGVIACTKDGRHFEVDEAKKLVSLARDYIMDSAKEMGALYLRFMNDQNDLTMLWQPNSAAVTCEMTREEVAARDIAGATKRADFEQKLRELL